MNTSNGTTVNYTYSDPVASTTTGKRYAPGTITGPASGFSANGAQSVTAAYSVQYQLSLATAPAGGGHEHISGASDGSWHDSGASVSLTADANVDILAGSSRYHFDNWTGDVASRRTPITRSR